MGSVAFAAAARAVWLVCRDKARPDRRLFLPLKLNLAAEPTGLAFTVVPSEGDGPPVLAWEPDPVDISALDALAPHEPSTLDQDEHVRWLRGFLESNRGVAPVAVIKAACSEAGVSFGAVQKVRPGVADTDKSDFGGGWVWKLKT